MNRLVEFFENENHRIIDKWIHYFAVYDKFFSKYKGKPVVILEIGVSHGGSLQMWKDYFGEQAHIYGVDINPACEKFREEQIEIFIGSQSDRNFLKEIKKKIPPVDILIDDGGHMMNQQIMTFKELFDHVKDDGVYICEDLHTSYWTTHGGGLKRRGTFIEFSKNLIDDLHGWYSRQSNFKLSSLSKSILGLHFYDSILVIEKGQISKPYSRRLGVPGFIEEPVLERKLSILGKINYHIDQIMAKIRVAKRF